MELFCLVAPCFGSSYGDIRQSVSLNIRVKTCSDRAIKTELRKKLKTLDGYVATAPWNDLAVAWTEFYNPADYTLPYIERGITRYGLEL